MTEVEKGNQASLLNTPDRAVRAIAISTWDAVCKGPSSLLAVLICLVFHIAQWHTDIDKRSVLHLQINSNVDGCTFSV